MRKIFKLAVAMFASALVTTSCELNFAPEDYYGSENYWQNEEHVTSYIVGMHSNMRGLDWQRNITFGELRSGIYRLEASSDGNVLSGVPYSTLSYDAATPGPTSFAGFYGRITNVLIYIQNVEEADYLTDAKKQAYLGLGYGLRAFYYFDLLRNYGAAPLRLTPDVVNGELDPEKLYMARTYPKVILAQIEADIAKSLECYGSGYSFNPYGMGTSKGRWSKAATEALAADVYMWKAKVSTPWIDPITGEDGGTVADPAAITQAKEHLLSLMNNYGLALQSDFAKIFDVTNKENSEVIFAMKYIEGESTNGYSQFLYNMDTGNVRNTFDRDGNLWGNKLNLSTASSLYEYDTTLFQYFSADDDRRDKTFIESYAKKEATGDVLYIDGTHCLKNIGYKNSQGNNIYNGDAIYWRLAWVYLSLAEVANFEGNNADVEKYMNLVRDRAGLPNYVASDFTTNELAILEEKTKEFVQEGQRWWDLCRMTYTKGGEALVFRPEASLTGKAVLSKDDAFRLLFPLDIAILGNDPSLCQTPGY